VGAGLAFAQATARSYQNPILRGMNPDPSVIRVGQDYYLATSSFWYFPGCPIYHSRDLVNWERIGYALTRPSQFLVDKNHGHPETYAATLRYHAGTFYLITTEVNGGGNFYVTAKNPAGPWSEPIVVDKPMFDPSLMFDDDGKVYYTRRGDFKDKDIVQAEIDIKTGKLLAPLRPIAKGMVSDDTEGPHLYKIGDWYYLSLAEGGSRYLHMQAIGRSRSPWGPFEPSPHNPWISQHTAWWKPVKSTGHAELVDTPDSHWWVVYLGTRHGNYDAGSMGRETFLSPVEWKDGWPTVKPENIDRLTIDATPLAAQIPPAPQRDDFSAPVLGLDWNLLGPPATPTYSLTERPGFLRLHGQGDGLAPSPQTAFVGRRQTEWQTSASTRVEFTPTKESEEAGLTTFMAGSYHYEIYKTQDHGKNIVALRKVMGDVRVVTATAEVGDGPIWLKIDSTADVYTFSYAQKRGEWKVLGTGMERFIASEIAAVWTGAYYGMYSTGNGTPCTYPADFDWFEYVPTPLQPSMP
jgi:xylan 1,4-beta-xylosidase